MIPGSNLLNQATSIIAKQTVSWHRLIGTVTNEIGTDVNAYASPKFISGSWQPVPRRLYQSQGLDFNNIYVTFYVSKKVMDVQRDCAGDQITYMNKRFQVVQANDWIDVDGWTAVLLVQIGDQDAR